MKKIVVSLALMLMVLAIGVAADKPVKCTTIQSGELSDSSGNTITTGYDDWGYNYQAQIFNGYYDNYNRPTVPVETGDWLSMKWNDAWLSNKDCDGDHLLDRHYGFDSYIGSGAWLTNHMVGTYEGDEGETCHYTYFVKIVAMPEANFDCASIGGYPIWSQFCVIQEVINDPCEGSTGVETLADNPGLGFWK